MQSPNELQKEQLPTDSDDRHFLPGGAFFPLGDRHLGRARGGGLPRWAIGTALFGGLLVATVLSFLICAGAVCGD